jgi:hypothetical protein
MYISLELIGLFSQVPNISKLPRYYFLSTLPLPASFTITRRDLYELARHCTTSRKARCYE